MQGVISDPEILKKLRMTDYSLKVVKNVGKWKKKKRKLKRASLGTIASIQVIFSFVINKFFSCDCLF